MPSLEVVEVPMDAEDADEEEDVADVDGDEQTQQQQPPQPPSSSSNIGNASGSSSSNKKKRKSTAASTETNNTASSSSKSTSKKKKKKNQLTLGSFFGVAAKKPKSVITASSASSATAKKTTDKTSTTSPMATKGATATAASTSSISKATAKKAPATLAKVPANTAPPSQLDYMEETRKSALRDIVVGRPRAMTSDAAIKTDTATKPPPPAAATAEKSTSNTAATTLSISKVTTTSTTSTTATTTTTTSSKSTTSSSMARGIANKPSPNRLFLEEDDEDPANTKDTILATEITTAENDDDGDEGAVKNRKMPFVLNGTTQEAIDLTEKNNSTPKDPAAETTKESGDENDEMDKKNQLCETPSTKEAFEKTESGAATTITTTPLATEPTATCASETEDVSPMQVVASADNSDTATKKQPAKSARRAAPAKKSRTSPRVTKGSLAESVAETSESGTTENVTPIQVVDADGSSATAKQTPAVKEIPTTTHPASPNKLQLSKEAQDLLKKHSAMRETYCRRADELLQQCRAGLEDEAFAIAVEAAEISDNYQHTDVDAFPDFAVSSLAALLEGRHEALSVLAPSVVERLKQLYGEDNASLFVLEAVTAKIKLLATRKNYIKNPAIASGLPIAGGAGAATNVFEDESEDHMWRWEVAVIELLPETSIPEVKKARSARKKLSSHFNALAKLLSALSDADALIQNISSSSKPSKLDAVLAKISQEEEKVLKYEREEEKRRLAAEAKRSKEAAKAEARAKKELEAKEKQQMVEEKRKEKEEAAALKQKKKEQAAEAKRKKEAKREEQRAHQQAELDKQKNLMNSFFAAATAKKKRAPLQQVNPASSDMKESLSVPTKTVVAPDSFDVGSFRAAIGSKKTTTSLPAAAQLFSSVSKRARSSRKRRSKRITVSVFVTVYPEGHDEMNPFAAQPYAEQQDVEVVNKYKFLSFHEDVRPAYYGTWSKKSTIITGTKPFAKDTNFLDYDVDSEGEWEEGDDEIGEELGDDKADADEDMKMEVGGSGGDDDGWLAADDEVEEDLDEETKQLRKKKKSGKDEEKRVLTVCIVAPGDGGKPLTRVTPDATPTQCKGRIEGFQPNEAYELIEKLSSTRLHQSELFLDAFPPSEDVDVNQDPSSAPNAPSSSTSSSSQTMTDENMQRFARFVHNCTLGSKDKVIDELLKAHKTVTSSRAQAYRVLDSIAEKKKHPRNGVFWEVKKDVLESLGLDELADTTLLDADDAKQEAIKTIALFVHNCTTASKEKIVDDLRIEHESVTSSRAEATRILTSISEKKKHPVSGYYWEVKEDVRDELGLTDLLPSSPPNVSSVKSIGNESKSRAEAISGSESNAKKGTPSTLQKTKSPASSSPLKQSSGQKRPATSSGSAKLLAAFVKKKKST